MRGICLRLKNKLDTFSTPLPFPFLVCVTFASLSMWIFCNIVFQFRNLLCSRDERRILFLAGTPGLLPNKVSFGWQGASFIAEDKKKCWFILFTLCILLLQRDEGILGASMARIKQSKCCEMM